ncbi:GNAT family [Colletotrichum kahawae]|uniref:GNAT family n=1 Tax=Colletotrichum kahawae TaxID=34407 RepID=A0AAE0DDJ1_COLKA|nr:GNAT family [Colletotrichum kahawae]
MGDGLENAFRSERLIFRAIEDDEDDQRWFHEQIKNDPVGFALGDSNVLRPQTKSRSDSLLLEIQGFLLGVIVCLPVADEATSPQPIGVVALNDEAGDNYRHHHRLAVLSISIANPYRNLGYGAEAIN